MCTSPLLTLHCPRSWKPCVYVRLCICVVCDGHVCTCRKWYILYSSLDTIKHRNTVHASDTTPQHTLYSYRQSFNTNTSALQVKVAKKIEPVTRRLCVKANRFYSVSSFQSPSLIYHRYMLTFNMKCTCQQHYHRYDANAQSIAHLNTTVKPYKNTEGGPAAAAAAASGGPNIYIFT